MNDLSPASLNSLNGKSIQNITMNSNGFVTFWFSKKRKITIPYSPIFDENGNLYRLSDVKFVGEK